MKLGSSGRYASPPVRPAQIRVFALGLCTLLSLNALAFNSSLQPEEVQEAYSLGQTSNHEELTDFIKLYEHNFVYPSDNPVAYVQSIELQTPYEQIVLRSTRGGAKYSKFQAVKDYRANPTIVIVRVLISLKTQYAGPVPIADHYEIAVSQTKSIVPKKTSISVLCNPYSQVPTA